MSRLKVYRTRIGFHDAYVPAPSQKAALQAWGSDADLFARGIAGVVTYETLIAEPLASLGKVIRKLRGASDEQFAAAGMPDGRKAHTRDDGGGAEGDNTAARAGMPLVARVGFAKLLSERIWRNDPLPQVR